MRPLSPALAPHKQALEYLEVPIRRPWMVAIPLILCTLGSIAAFFLAPRMYRSSTLIMVESDRVPDSFVPKMATDTASRRLYTLKQEILSRTRLERIILELNPYPEARAKGVAIGKLVDSMRDAITVNVKGADAFLVEYTHRSPGTAMQVATRLASLFTDEVTQAREDQIEGAYDFIQSQLEEARRQLETNEQAVRIYKEKHLGALPEQLPANLATLQRLQLEQQSLNDNIRAAEERQNLFQFQKTVIEQARPGEQPRTPDPVTELGQLRAQLGTLRSRYTDAHPDVQALRGRIARLEETQVEPTHPVSAETTEAPADATRSAALLGGSDLRLLKAKRADLDVKIAGFQTRVEQTPRTEQELGILTRDSAKLRENYLALLNKKLEAQRAEKLEQRWKGEHFRTLDPASLPDRPYFPSFSIFLAVGLGFGLVLGTGLAFGAEFLDHSVKSITELESVLPLPVLTTLSHIPIRRRGFISHHAARAAREA